MCDHAHQGSQPLHRSKPVGPTERIPALDVLRGFAMFGVLVAYCMWSLGTAPEDDWSRLDEWLAEAVHFAVDGKFYTILAFLFGLGFSIQLARAADDPNAIETYCRRLAALAAIGLGHALLLRNSDILLPYALTGFLMIPFRRLSDRAIVTAAFIAMLIPAAAHALWQASGALIPQRPHLEQAPYLVENAAWVHYWYSTAIFTWPTNITLFCSAFSQGVTVSCRERQVTGGRCDLRPGGNRLRDGSLLCAPRAACRFADPASVRGPALHLSLLGLSSACAAASSCRLAHNEGRSRASSARGDRPARPHQLPDAGGLDRTVMPDLRLVRPVHACDIAGAGSRRLPAGPAPFSLLWLRYFEFGPAEWLWRVFNLGVRRRSSAPLPLSAPDATLTNWSSGEQLLCSDDLRGSLPYFRPVHRPCKRGHWATADRRGW